MALKIVVSNTVKFTVKGTLKDEEGIDQPFNFRLTCSRMNTDQIKAAGTETPIPEFLAKVIEDWDGVRGADDKPLPFTEANLSALLKMQGMAFLVYSTYMTEAGAKAKN